MSKVNYRGERNRIVNSDQDFLTRLFSLEIQVKLYIYIKKETNETKCFQKLCKAANKQNKTMRQKNNTHLDRSRHCQPLQEATKQPYFFGVLTES